MVGQGRRLVDWLSDIVEWGEKLGRSVSVASFEEFNQNEMAVLASMKCIEALGEASRRILQQEPDFQVTHPELQLRQASQARNRLSHGYFDVNSKRVWDTAHTEVPQLVAAVKRILAELEAGKTE